METRDPSLMDEKFRTAMSLWMYQDKMFWDRITTMYVIHLPILGGAYALFENGSVAFATAILAAGAFVGFMIWDLAQKDKADRDINLDYLNAVLTSQGLKLLADASKGGSRRRNVIDEYGWHLMFLVGPVLIDIYFMAFMHRNWISDLASRAWHISLALVGL